MRPFAALFALLLVHAAPPDAAKSLAEARALAKRGGKNVLVVFHASWCGWCKKFDRMLADETVKPLIEKGYVVVHLDVMENGEKKSLENPGGAKILASLGGDKAGLPFLAVVAPDGKKLGDSLMKPGDQGSNTGHPAAPEEIDHFMKLLSATATKMSEADRAKVETYLKADAAKR